MIHNIFNAYLSYRAASIECKLYIYCHTVWKIGRA
jgi:hypothetical protein